MKAQAIFASELTSRYEREGWWINRSLIEYFDEAVARTPEKIALVAPRGARMTYAEMAVQVDRIAANLARRGIKAGDVISVQLPNWSEAALIHLSASRLNAITNPLLPSYRAKELAYILRFAATAAVFIPNHYRNFDFPQLYRELKPQLPDLRHVFVVDDDAASFERFADLLSPAAKPAPVPIQGDDVTALIFTSGTELTPKGVMHSHNTCMYATLTMARLLGLNAEDVVWVPSPVGHGTGFLWGIREAVTLGAKLVLQDQWDAQEALQLIEQEGCTFTLAATPFVAMLLESPDLKKRDLSSFRSFACAGAPIPEQVGIRAQAEIGCKLIGMWGMSECFVGSASAPTDPDKKLWGSDGKAMPGGELAIFDENRSRQLGPGETGELATRGPHVALGYFNDPERTRETFRSDGWLFSSDLATIDEDGYIRIVGRRKDIINRGGLKISAREIEELLNSDPRIRQAAVAPVVDARLGEKCCAFVVTQNPLTFGFDDMVRHLESRGLAKYKCPEYLVVLDALPMTPSGKIKKFELVEQFNQGRCQVMARR